MATANVDYDNPIIGYRAWRVCLDVLQAICNPYDWSAHRDPRNTLRGSCPVPMHTDIPVASCACGYWAWASWQKVSPHPLYAVGKVRMWGRIIRPVCSPRQMYYRSEYAYPIALYADHGWERVRNAIPRIAKKYSIEVLPLAASMRTRFGPI